MPKRKGGQPRNAGGAAPAGNSNALGNQGGASFGNSNAQKTIRYICNCRGYEHDYKTAQHLKLHLETSLHQRLTDPEFAKTEAV